MGDGPSPFDGMEIPDATNEEGTERDGVLSYSAEWHAIAVGFGAGFTGSVELIAPLVAFVLGLGTEQLRRSDHLKDASREPAYTFAGIAIGLVANALTVGHSLLPPLGGLL